MFVIRQRQTQRFKDVALASFEAEMALHCRAISPQLSAAVDDEQLREVIRQAIRRARRRGFTRRGPVRLFIELTLLFGCAFDTDPLYAWAAEILKSDDAGSQMLRASQLYHRTLEHLESVAGPDDTFTRRALEQLGALLWLSQPPHTGDVVAVMRGEIARAYPEKAARAGDGGIELLFREALHVSAAYGMAAAHEQALLCVLFFVLGHGCADDPLYPWIARVLKGGGPATRDERAAFLRRKATAWIEHVIAAHHR